ncbi:MAG: thymidine phosphorylase [Armatimonadota bacterium]|nr:thymidine phosphorylase [Armatimonadota bacterium]
MNVVDVIAAKRDGKELSELEIRQLVLNYDAGRVPDYQMAAFLMAAYLQGLSLGETIALTRAMVDSGTTLDLSKIAGIKVDKHSSGGVGDKTTLVLVPMLAACGLKVPKMSGRGLGFTGGTLDKLESIPGFTTALNADRFIQQVQHIGAAIAGQTDDLVPADKKIYALRDVTATVDSIPLIAASIMSKKIACSSDIILIDVKVGSGAFMKDLDQARNLSRMLLAVGQSFNRQIVVVITDMNQPLGRAVGNSLEVVEAIDTLKGCGPSDLRELCVQLCGFVLNLVEYSRSDEECAARASAVLDSGDALEVFREIIVAQGGNSRVIEDTSLLPLAQIKEEVASLESGFVEAINCAAIGKASAVLGAGRERKEDRIDPAVGVVVRKKLGDPVERGEVLAEIHANDGERASAARKLIADAYCLGPQQRPGPSLIYEVIR